MHDYLHIYRNGLVHTVHTSKENDQTYKPDIGVVSGFENLYLSGFLEIETCEDGEEFLRYRCSLKLGWSLDLAMQLTCQNRTSEGTP